MRKIGILLGLPLAALFGLGGYFLAGYYPIGADSPHWPITTELITLVREASIERQASDVRRPEHLASPELIRRGAGNYAAMCAACHLAPGKPASELQAGLYPQPPELALMDIDDEARAFTIIKHGIKLTGMPAWGSSHSDEDIWALVAFLKQLPGLSAEEYLALSQLGHNHGSLQMHLEGESQPPADPHAHHDGHTGHSH